MAKLSISQLRAFDAVAREGGMSKAAARLGLTQPTVTMQVRDLEKRCGVALFRRAADGVTLTEEGRRLVALTRELTDAERLIEEFVGALQGVEIGTLALAADGPHVALDVIKALRAAHPSVKVTVTLDNADGALARLRAGRVDAAIMGRPGDETGLHVVPILTQDVVAILPAGHRLAARERLDLAEFLGEPLILRERGSNTRRFLEAAAAVTGLGLAPVLELGSREAVKEAVAVGLGVSAVLDREAVGDTRLAAVAIAGLDGLNRDAVVCSAGAERRPSVRALIRAARSIGG